MAVEMFLRLDGITGGSRSYHHKGWSDLLSWRWGLDRAPGADAALHMNEIILIKPVGMESSALMTLFAERKLVKAAEIHVVPVVGKRDAQQKYLALTLEGLLIKSIMTGGTAEDSVFSENITCTFDKVKFEFNQYADAGPDGGAQKAESYIFGWDIAANKAW